jgi:hypothetical protein
MKGPSEICVTMEIVEDRAASRLKSTKLLSGDVDEG